MSCMVETRRARLRRALTRTPPDTVTAASVPSVWPNAHESPPLRIACTTA